jgi:single-strand DNA-binding protein
VYAEGRSQTRSWETSEGQRRYTTEVVVDKLEMLGPRPDPVAATE